MRRDQPTGIHAGRLLLVIGVATVALVGTVLLLATSVVGRVEDAAAVNTQIAETRRQITEVDDLANQLILAAREEPGPLNTSRLLEQRGSVLIERIRQTCELSIEIESDDALIGTDARVERLVDAVEGMVHAGSASLDAQSPASRAESIAVLDVLYQLFRHDLAELRNSLTVVESNSLQTQAEGVSSISRWTLAIAALASLLVLAAGVAAKRVTKREQSLLSLLRERSVTDPLTQLLNRRGFNERAAAALRGRQPGEAAALLFLDLDGFKTINDSMGHSAGDLILQTVGNRIDRSTRSDDIVARLGGDEFAVLLRWPNDSGDPVTMAHRLRTAIAEDIELLDQRVKVGVSIGLRRIKSDEVEIEELLRDADVAMYAAKRRRDAGIQEFEASLVDAVVDRVELEDALRHAIHHDELTVHYQPIVDGGGSLVGAEALVRWFRDGEAIFPDQFLPVAADLGLMPELDRLVLRRATIDIARINRRLGTNLRVAVNIAAEEAEHRELGRRILKALSESELPANRLVIEVTEQGALESLERATEVLDAVRSLGVQTALDDFGTGNSALFYLDKLPIDILKIDRAFLPVDGDDQRRHELFATVVELGNRLGFNVVAEGIETDRQQALAIETGCLMLQGYHLGRPAPIEQLTALVEESLVIDLAA